MRSILSGYNNLCLSTGFVCGVIGLFDGILSIHNDNESRMSTKLYLTNPLSYMLAGVGFGYLLPIAIPVFITALTIDSGIKNFKHVLGYRSEELTRTAVKTKD